jgi:heptosyltransferase II
VVFRLPNWLGDVVMAAPAVAAIAAALPNARVTAEVIAPFVPLARLLPGVHEAMPFVGSKGVRGAFAARRALREKDFDGAVVFPRSVRAAVAPWLARIPVRVGFGGPGKRPFLTHRVTGWEPLRRGHRSAFYGALARPFATAPAGPLALTAPPAALEAADRLLQRLGRRGSAPLVALEPGARYGPAKCWTPERFGELARALVTNDTGPMHLAAALGTPVLALFGATDPIVSGPRGPGRAVVVMDPEPCSPCFLRDCPIPGHPCLTKIGAPRVFRAALALLGRDL